jgi:hypothetical protein
MVPGDLQLSWVRVQGGSVRIACVLPYNTIRNIDFPVRRSVSNPYTNFSP